MADPWYQDPLSPEAQGYYFDLVGNYIAPLNETGTYVPPSETVEIIADTTTGMDSTLTPEQTATMQFYDYLIAQYPDFYLGNIDQAILDAQILTNYAEVANAFDAAGLVMEGTPWQRYNDPSLQNYNLYSTFGGDWGGTGYGDTDILRYETNSIWGAYTGTTRDFTMQLADQLGLSYEQMIQAAQQAWQQHYDTNGQGYTEASSPLDIATAIGNNMLTMAGYPTTQFFTDEQLIASRTEAQAVQDGWKEMDEADSGFGQVMDIVSSFMSGPGALLALAGGITTLANLAFGAPTGLVETFVDPLASGIGEAGTLAGTTSTIDAALTGALDLTGTLNPELGMIADNTSLMTAMDGGLTAAELEAMGAVGSAAEAEALYTAYQAGQDVSQLTYDPNTGQLVDASTVDPSLDPNFDGTDINQVDPTVDPTNTGTPTTTTTGTGGTTYPDPYAGMEGTLGDMTQMYGSGWEGFTAALAEGTDALGAWLEMGGLDSLLSLPGLDQFTEIFTGSGSGGGLLGTLTGSIEQLLGDFLGTGDGGGSLLDMLNDAFGAYAAYDYSDQMEDMLNMGIEAVRWKDPFWDALAKGVGTYGIGGTAYGDAIANNVTRTQAAQGYDFSGNMLHELASGLNDASLDAIKTFDTAARPTSNVYGDMFSSFGPAIASQWMNTSGAIGNMLGGTTTSGGGGTDWGNLFNTAWDWLSGGQSAGTASPDYDWTDWDWTDLGGIFT